MVERMDHSIVIPSMVDNMKGGSIYYLFMQ